MKYSDPSGKKKWEGWTSHFILRAHIVVFNEGTNNLDMSLKSKLGFGRAQWCLIFYISKKLPGDNKPFDSLIKL